MPAKVQSIKAYLIPNQQVIYATLSIAVDPMKCHIVAQQWNYSDQPMMLTLADDGITVEIRFLHPFKYSWIKRLLGIKPFIKFSVIELTEAPAKEGFTAPAAAPTNG